MNSNFHPDIFVLNHVPKAGGSSIIKLFEAIYGKERVFHSGARNVKNNTVGPSIYDLSDSALSRYKLIAGHFNYGLHHRLPCVRVGYLSVVRDPIERLESRYWHMRQRGNKAEMQLARSLTLNGYSRMLVKSGRLSGAAQALYVGASDDFDVVRNIIDKHYFMICATENLDKMQLNISNYLSSYERVSCPSPVKVNSRLSHKPNEKPHGFSLETRKFLLHHCHVDSRLHSYVYDR